MIIIGNMKIKETNIDKMTKTSGAVAVEVVLSVIILNFAFFIVYDLAQYFKAKQNLKTAACMASRSIAVSDTWHSDNPTIKNVATPAARDALCDGDCPQGQEDISPYHTIAYIYSLPELLAGKSLSNLEDYLSNLKSLPESFLNDFASYAKDRILEILQEILEPLNRIQEEMRNFAEKLKSNLQELKNKFEALWNDARTQLSEITGSLNEIITSIENVLNEIQDAQDDFSFYSKALEDHHQKISDLVQSINPTGDLQQLPSKFETQVRQKVQDKINNMTNAISQAASGINNSAMYSKQIIDGFVQSAKDTYDAISQAIETIRGGGAEELEKVGEIFTKTITSFNNTVTYFVRGAIYFGGFRKQDIINSMPNDLKNFKLSNIIEPINDIVRRIIRDNSFDICNTVAQNVCNTTIEQVVREHLEGLPERTIEDDLREIDQALQNAMTDIESDISIDLENAKEEMLEILRNTAASSDTIRKIAEIKKYVIGGVELAEEGVNDFVSRVEGTVESTAKSVEEAKKMIPIARNAYDVIRQDVEQVLYQFKKMSEEMEQAAKSLIQALEAAECNQGCDNMPPGIKQVCCALERAKAKIANLPEDLKSRIISTANNTISEIPISPNKIFYRFYCVIKDGNSVSYKPISFQGNEIECYGKKMNSEEIVGIYSIVGINDYPTLTPLFDALSSEDPACSDCDPKPPVLSAGCLWPTYGRALKIYNSQ